MGTVGQACAKLRRELPPHSQQRIRIGSAACQRPFMLSQLSGCLPCTCRSDRAGTKFCAFVDETGALRSADCKSGKRLVYCEYDLPTCP